MCTGPKQTTQKQVIWNDNVTGYIYAYMVYFTLTLRQMAVKFMRLHGLGEILQHGRNTSCEKSAQN